MARSLPLVVVLGATGCGKSRLAIELAKRFSGEIISADSMQVYHGLDIVTNKVTEEDRAQAKHHMIDFLDPMVRFSVVDFRNQAVEIIDELLGKKSLPIVVGGTNYYIESLIWKGFLLGSTLDATKRPLADQLDPSEVPATKSRTIIDRESRLLNRLPKTALHEEDDLSSVEKFFAKPIYNDAFTHVEGAKLWDILKQVDEDAAKMYHPNDKRRLIRCLQIIQEKQKKYSEILRDVNVSGVDGKSSLGGPLRYENTCVFWLNCDKETLERMQEERVDKMLDRGLLAELELFHEDYNKQRVKDGEKPTYDKGIFQTIGFKEFHEYLILPADIKSTDEGNRLFRKSIDSLKISTRQYANRQLKWIRRRFVPSPETRTRDLPQLFKLDIPPNETDWAQQVSEPAFKIVESFIDGSTDSPRSSHE